MCEAQSAFLHLRATYIQFWCACVRIVSLSPMAAVKKAMDYQHRIHTHAHTHTCTCLFALDLFSTFSLSISVCLCIGDDADDISPYLLCLYFLTLRIVYTSTLLWICMPMLRNASIFEYRCFHCIPTIFLAHHLNRSTRLFHSFGFVSGEITKVVKIKWTRIQYYKWSKQCQFVGCVYKMRKRIANRANDLPWRLFTLLKNVNFELWERLYACVCLCVCKYFTICMIMSAFWCKCLSMYVWQCTYVYLFHRLPSLSLYMV